MRSATPFRRPPVRAVRALLFAVLMAKVSFAQIRPSPQPDVGRLISAIQQKEKGLQNSSGMRQGFQAFMSRHHLAPRSVRYSDYVVVRLVFEAARDAGFWNLHWTITNEPPNSDRVWQQWQKVVRPSPLTPTASAECDELSALYAFLVERTGVRRVGLVWPYPNHTAAVWMLHPAGAEPLRIVVPTSQIFLEPTDFFDTTKFYSWRQKTRAATFRILSSCPSRFLIFSSDRSTDTQGSPTSRFSG
jgi:hypothetical protein